MEIVFVFGEWSILLKRNQCHWDWHFKIASIQWLRPSVKSQKGRLDRQYCTWEQDNKEWRLSMCLQALQDAACIMKAGMY